VDANPGPADWVDPRSGTAASRWFFFSSACRPFGMVNLSPDTRTGGDWANGYLYGDKKIRCFSHIHGWQLYGIAVMPFTGEARGHLGMDRYASEFSHQDEVARCGYHKVVLKTYGVTAELTSTMRVGFHRYHFPDANEAGVLLDTGATLMDKIASSQVRRVSDTELEGQAVMAPTARRPKPFIVYFVAQFSRSFRGFRTWQEGRMLAPSESVSGRQAGAYVTFDPSSEPVLMKVAISYTSVDRARLNLGEELPHWDFDRVVRESRDEWNRWLGRIEVAGGTTADRTRFYTDLWHASLGRRVVSDVDGAYCDNTGDPPRVRRVAAGPDGRPRFPHHNSDAFWGAHWSINLLWSLAYPEVMDAFCNTMVDMYRDGGLIPRGPAGGNYTFVMIGDPAASLFAAAYHKGIRNYDIGTAYEGLRKNAFPGGIRDHAGYEHDRSAAGGGMKYYVERGYVPEGIEGRGMHKDGASMTLEYTYQDWCLAQLAGSLGNAEDAKVFAKRAQNYTALWDGSGWMRPRNKDGSWLADFAPVAATQDFSAKGFCEATAAIYTHFVPQDPCGLARLFGGPDRYAEALDRQFSRAAPDRFIVPHGQHGAAWIDYENQPSTGMAHMFNFAGHPWLSQKWVREVRQAVFSDVTPREAYHGDEDQGEMGSVAALMAMGLFDEQGGAARNPTWQITAPVFDRVTIHLNPAYCTGKTFTIVARNQGPSNVYIQSARLNDQPMTGCWFLHKDLAAGGTLELDLGPEPNRSWGISPAVPTGAVGY
jgi:predicted alpha-1,2-mannosidase